MVNGKDSDRCVIICTSELMGIWSVIRAAVACFSVVAQASYANFCTCCIIAKLNCYISRFVCAQKYLINGPGRNFFIHYHFIAILFHVAICLNSMAHSSTWMIFPSTCFQSLEVISGQYKNPLICSIHNEQIENFHHT